ncbi:MAG: hypothetical protein K5871_07985 [Lachnospiraceae bacterium]|nr:hypothetical protein [Lachnospiraceae bacterium]
MKYGFNDLVKFRSGNLIGFLIGCVCLLIGVFFMTHVLSLDIVNDLVGRQAFHEGSEPVFLLIGGLIFLIFALIFFSDLAGYSKMKKKLDEIGADKVLDQINNHLLYAAKKSGSRKPVCFFTEEYIVSVANDIIPINDVVWTYVHYQNNSPFYTLKLAEGREFRPGVMAYNDCHVPCDEAIRKVNPNLLVGYSKENAAAYKAIVKAHK